MSQLMSDTVAINFLAAAVGSFCGLPQKCLSFQGNDISVVAQWVRNLGWCLNKAIGEFENIIKAQKLSAWRNAYRGNRITALAKDGRP